MTAKTDIPADIRTVRYRMARLIHWCYPSGRMRRFLVLDSQALREALDKPRRAEIDALDYDAETGRLPRCELWELAERTARRLLRALYAKAAETPASCGHARRALGTVLAPTAKRGEARGLLVYAGVRKGIPYCIELLTVEGVVRRIEGIDLARALLVADAEVGDRIRITCNEVHRTEIREQRSGAHGSGQRMLRRSRVLYEITKETSSDLSHAYRQPRERSGAALPAEW